MDLIEGKADFACRRCRVPDNETVDRAVISIVNRPIHAEVAIHSRARHPIRTSVHCCLLVVDVLALRVASFSV